MDDWLSVLRNEFEAGEGSLLIKIRGDLAWDVDAYNRLVTAMEACCRAKSGDEQTERWIADGFWYMSWFVRDWTSHPNFPRRRPDEYYEAANVYLFNLAFWFFTDSSPWNDDGMSARRELSRLEDLGLTDDHLKD